MPRRVLTPEEAAAAAAAEVDGQRSLRRIEILTAFYAVAGAVAFALRSRFESALVLTLLGVAAILAFRSLQGLVSRFGAARTGRVGGATRLLLWLRTALLVAAVLAVLILGPENNLALVAGVSTLPAALLTEGAVQAARALVGRQSDGT